MSLHSTRASALLAWVNSLRLDDALNSLSQLQDCSIFIKIINKIQGTEEEQAIRQQSVPERIAYVCSFLDKYCKHKSTTQSLISKEKLLVGEQLELAKVVMLLLFHASMSDRIPKEWTTVEYNLQAEMAGFLNFMLYNEECLSENLENFLQKKMSQRSSVSSTSSEESTPPKRGVQFLKLHKIASSSSMNKFLSGSSSSPMGDIIQTPQFQMRRLKKLLEAERENRDELEHELAENRKLIDEKDTRIQMMKQQIDRLTLLHERQAADQLESKEMEELRERNESLLVRLHETLKQCQDLKSEKGQMDRKINQLLEENGDLSFRLREFASALTELQETVNELSEEHNTAVKEWEEQRAHLESELRNALAEKKCLEEKLEILQGKISLLEDQLVKLKESSSLSEKGEVMGNVLELEDLKQQVASLNSKQMELRATVRRLEEEKHLLEANLQSERSGFAEEKLQLTSLLTSLQNSVLELSQAKDKLEQESRAQDEHLTAQVNTLTTEMAKLTSLLHQKDQEVLALQQQVEAERSQKGRLAEDLQRNEQASRAAIQELSLQVDQLSNRLKQSSKKLAQVEAAGQEEYNKAAQEKELALRQLQEKRAELSALTRQLRSLEEEAQREKAELNQKVQELDARILALTAQCQQSEAQVGALPALKGQLREAQQKLADKEKLAKENTRLQERLLVLEESVRNTEGILEDEKRRAAESLEGNLRRIADLEEQAQELAKHRDQAVQAVEEERARRQALEAEVQQLGAESRAKVEELQHQLGALSSAAQGDAGLSGELEEKLRSLSADREQVRQQLQAEREKVVELEGRVRCLSTRHQEALAALEADVSHATAQLRAKENLEEKLRAEVASLQEKTAATQQDAAQAAAKAKEDGRKAAAALEEAARELTEERHRRAELEARVKQLGEQSQKDLAVVESSLSSLRAAMKDKEQEVEQLSGQVKTLQAKLEDTTQQQKCELAAHKEETKRLASEKEQVQAELATEKASKAALEVQLQNVSNELRVEVSGLQEEVARAREFVEEKERELEELRLKNVSRNEELRDLQKTVSKLKGELASVEALKERAAKMESELQGFLEVARTREAEMDNIKSIVHARDLSLKSLEEEKRLREQESASSRKLHEEKLKECEALRGQVEQLEQQCKEQHSTITRLEKAAAASKQQQQAEAEALKQDVAQQKKRTAELEKLLEASRSAQDSAVEKLKRELLDRGRELAQSREAASGAEKELASLRASAQEKGKSEESWKEQMSRCLQEGERKASLISSLEQEMSIMHRQLMEKEAESKDLRRLVLAESEKSKKLEERLRLLQSEMATAASRAAERCSAMKAEAQNYQEQSEKLRGTSEALKKELGVLAKREEDLCKELQSWQEKAFQKEQLLLARQQEVAGAQALIGELMPIKRLYQQLQAEQVSLESKHKEEMEKVQKATGILQAELARTKQELSEAASVKERFLEQERSVQQLQAEKASYAERLVALQQAHAQLTEENQVLSERSSRGLQRLDAELVQAKQKHAQELEAARLDSENVVAVSRREVEEAQKKLETVTSKYEEAKQKLLVQVEQLEACQKERAKQVEELKQKLAQQEKLGRAQQQKAKVREEELQTEVKHQNEKMAELEAQLAQKEQAAEHYKTQMEKAKTHYDAKKQQNQELMEKLKGLEQLEKENTELKAESDRLVRELQHAVLQAKESELRTKNLTSQVHSLEAQVEFADRQLREQGKFQMTVDTLKSRKTFRQSPADISTDSLDMSTSDEGPPLISTSRKTRRSLSESGTAESSKASHPLPRKVESLESLHFTPIPTRARSRAENSIGSAADVSFESGRKTLSARRRTTQRHSEPEALSSASASFLSVQSASGAQASAPSQEPVKTRLRSAAASSSRSLASLPSQESLTMLGASSPEDKEGNTALMSLPGYRPATRSSMRRSQLGGASTGRSSFYMGTCQDEPDPLDDWNRIAELQQRNRVCPPHLKTCYPLESRPSQSLSTITDEEMKTGDPKETLRRATMLPAQIAEGRATRRSTLGSSWAAVGVATRQQRKRLSNESQQGPGTPESKKSASCFPRPQTPKGRHEECKLSTLAGSKKGRAQPADKQPERRQSLAFSILNTPKKLGNSLLRRGANRKVTPTKTPRGGSRRSPRTAASPKGKMNSKLLKTPKF
ncbi:nuclear mitotic apparatus protein 1 isoform X2 [Tiliqua scincoides]|uniref:nuclear mitotic apparatus protein 1 isoform X2 n=1 Tax=Tiliqua scincoides TaxID=71010 RepID=UPI0034629AA1